MDIVANEPFWNERYRPQSINDCILSAKNKKELLKVVESGRIPNMIFSGPPGTGKTTAAYALCKELDLDWIITNASEERGIDLIRDKVAEFCSTVSLSGNGKCFILDEADELLPGTQKAFRRPSEEFSKICSFIMTANYPNRIIPALRESRFIELDFSVDKKELPVLQARFYQRVCKILENENVEYEEKPLALLIQKLFPDCRKIINKLQFAANSYGRIDENVIVSIEEVSIDAFITAVKNKKFKEVLQFAEDNATNDTAQIYEKIFKRLKEFVANDSIPDAIVILEDYQRYDSVVASKQLHLASMGTEMMTGLEFK